MKKEDDEARHAIEAEKKAGLAAARALVLQSKEEHEICKARLAELQAKRNRELRKEAIEMTEMIRVANEELLEEDKQKIEERRIINEKLKVCGENHLRRAQYLFNHSHLSLALLIFRPNTRNGARSAKKKSKLLLSK